MVETVKYPQTLTDHYYDISAAVSYMEDKEACDLGIELFASEISSQCETAFHNGWYGWNRSNECSIEHLTQKMKKAFGEGDVVKVGLYLMMLNARGVTNFDESSIRSRLAAIGQELERLVSAEEVVLKLSNDGPHIDRVIADIHSEMSDLDKERLRLLKKIS